MIESGAYRELQSLVIRLCGRIAHLASTVSSKLDKWLTQEQEEVCKALRITKRALSITVRPASFPIRP